MNVRTHKHLSVYQLIARASRVRDEKRLEREEEMERHSGFDGGALPTAALKSLAAQFYRKH